ncbi:hypothetical protein CIB48_g10444 [Xylaria polymorpha]|nr:hypothetical protein CIB48_g10444 [Xylaria polymorpha]
MSGEHTGPSASPQTSPKTPGESTPYQTSLRGGGDRQAENRALESTGISQSNGETTQQSLPLRSLGVHTILNPSEAQPPLMRRRHEETASSPKAPSLASNSSPGVPPPFAFHGSGMARPGQTTPTIDDQPLTAPSSVERGSPGTARPYPPIAAARRALTPRSPRLISPGQSHPMRALNPPPSQPQHRSTVSLDSSRVISSEAGIPGRAEPPFPTRASPLVQQLSRVASPAACKVVAFFPVVRVSSQGTPQDTHRIIHTPLLSYPRPTVDIQGMEEIPGGRGGNEHSMSYGSPGVRSFAFGEGQAALRIQPAHGEAFIVPVDTHQGSRQADEKRQRNAGASQRFRKRKKDRETQERMEHQRMESQYRELEARIHALETDKERLRSDRDRLRDIVYRTPSVSELAYQGPSSPDPGNESGPSPLMPRPTYGAADPETGERSSQRRRTDPHPQVEFVNIPYGSAPGSLPPIAASGYPTSISHPGTPSGRSQAPQLPPLRLGSTSGTPTTTTVSAASTPVQAYQQLKRESYETGWATGPRASADPSQR